MNISEELIREIITKVVESAASEKKASDCGFEKHIDPSGIIGIKTSTVKCEPFEQDGVAHPEGKPYSLPDKGQMPLRLHRISG